MVLTANLRFGLKKHFSFLWKYVYKKKKAKFRGARPNDCRAERKGDGWREFKERLLAMGLDTK